MKKSDILDKIIITFLTLSLSSALLLLGLNILGYSIHEPNDSIIQPLCVSEDECTNQGETCCFFHGKDAGVCYPSKDCQRVYELTKEEPNINIANQKIKEGNYINKNLYSFLSYFFATSSIILVILISIKIINTKKKKSKKHKKRK